MQYWRIVLHPPVVHVSIRSNSLRRMTDDTLSLIFSAIVVIDYMYPNERSFVDFIIIIYLYHKVKCIVLLHHISVV